MTVFIAHAPQDKAAAEALAEKLRQRAFLVQLETGEGAMRPLFPSDAMVGLISRDFVFSPYKLRLEKRLLDAWADGQLVQVKLDHSFAPVGLRDLPAIDASFEAQREFTWNKVADAVRALRQNPFGNSVDMYSDTRAAPPPMAPASPAPQPPPQEWTQNQTWSEDRYSKYESSPAPTSTSARRKVAANKSGGGFGLFLLAALICGGAGAFFYAQKKGEAPLSFPASPAPAEPSGLPSLPPEIAMLGLSEIAWRGVLIAGAIGLGFLIMALIATRISRKAALERKMGKPSKSRTKFDAGAAAAASPAPAAARPPAVTPEPAANEQLIFISYARADEARVDPLAKAVKDSGHPIWIDTDAINAGSSWAGEIVRAIKSAGHVLIMCSPRSFESDQVKREVYLADRYKKPLMPVFLEAAEPPEDFEYFFAGVQWLRLHESPEADRPAILARALPAA